MFCIQRMRWEYRRQKTDDNAPGIDGKVRIGKTTIEYDGKVRIEVTDVVAEFLEDDRKRQQAQDRSDRRYLSKGNFERDCVESQRTSAFRDDTFFLTLLTMVHFCPFSFFTTSYVLTQQKGRYMVAFHVSTFILLLQFNWWL